MNIRFIVFYALILGGWLICFSLPALELLGVSVSIFLTAMFLPQIGWKRAILFRILILGMGFIIGIPSLMQFPTYMNSMLESVLLPMKPLFAKANDTAILQVTLDNLTPYWGVLTILLFPVCLLDNILCIWSYSRLLRKLGLYSIMIF